MARIRTIKPEFPQSESVGNLSREARLLFILLWTQADDEGRLRGASRLLASLLYPYDLDAADHIDGWLGELERERCIVRYQVKETFYLQITNWRDHQKIDRPTASRLPPPPERSTQSREQSRAVTPGPRTVDHGPRIKDHDRGGAAAAAATAGLLAGKLFEDFWKVYPRRDGANPKEPARKKFVALLKSGADADDIIAGASGYWNELQRTGKIGTTYVAQAVTWLNQDRWKDYLPRAEDAARRTAQDADMAARGYEWVEGVGWQKKLDLAMEEGRDEQAA